MAQHQQPDHSGAAITFLKVQPYQGGALILTSDAVDIDGWLSADHAQGGDEASPPLAWSGPPGIVTYALVVEDPDAPAEQPVVHWLMWNIPGSLHALPAGIATEAEPDGVGGATQGLNSHGRPGWLGMAPPPGHGPHRYHFQLFGLDRRLDLPVDTPLAELVNVLKGAAVAKGELVGLYEIRDGLMDAPSPARTGSYGRDQGDPPARAEADAGRGGLDRDDPDRHAPHDADGGVRPD
jgi:Raf kinase inhibitor-like YbhB/YbcL family protein